jgi:Cu-Zn family superoxide dismutase
MKLLVVSCVVGVLAGAESVIAAQTKGEAAGAAGPTTRVRFRNAENEPIGEAVLRQTPKGVLIDVKLSDLPAGEHGFHVHETGKCEPPFESAGGHFNPTRTHHGYEHPKGPHLGDLPNLVVPESGAVEVELFAEGLTLDPGKPNSVLDANGSALMVHSGPDDYRTDPAGASGDRIACGVVERPERDGGGRATK